MRVARYLCSAPVHTIRCLAAAIVLACALAGAALASAQEKKPQTEPRVQRLILPERGIVRRERRIPMYRRSVRIEYGSSRKHILAVKFDKHAICQKRNL